MAIKVKAKPKKITRTKIMTIDRLYLGDEPINIGVLTDEDRGSPLYIKALGWYNYMYSVDEAKEFILEYMRKNEYPRDQISAVRRANKNATVTTIGWQARIMMNGNTLSPKSMEFFHNRLAQNIAAGMAVEIVDVVDKPVINIQDRVRAKIDQMITDCEQALDEQGNSFAIYDWMTANEVTQQTAGVIRSFYERNINDWSDNDPEVIAMCGKTNYNKQKQFWINFIADVDRFINNKKVVKVRKPREKKVKSAVDQVKSLKFQKNDPTLKIVSVHPAEIVGCNQLWAYNTKYKKLTKYMAVGPTGIQVKGATLTGWDVDASVSKSLRKPEQSIQELLSAGKVVIRSFMENLKTSASKPTGRINEQTILLRVIK